MAEIFFYVATRLDDKGLLKGLRVVTDTADLKDKSEKVDKKNEDTLDKAPSKFRDALDDFVRSMDTYREFMPVAAIAAPAVSLIMAANGLQKFLATAGKERPDLAESNEKVFELGLEAFPEFQA